MKTQKQIVLEILKSGETLTPMDGFELGITRLAAVVFELREDGHDIITETVHAKNRRGRAITYARYSLGVE